MKKDYAYPKCPRCGHNYFNMKPQKIVNGVYPTAGLCQWCCKEVADE